MQGLVAGSSRVGVDFALVPGLLAEALDEPGLAVADNDQPRSLRLDSRFLVVQLHHLLLAKESAKMANECDDNGSPFPEGLKGDLLAALVEDRQICQRVTIVCHSEMVFQATPPSLSTATKKSVAVSCDEVQRTSPGSTTPSRVGTTSTELLSKLPLVL